MAKLFKEFLRRTVLARTDNLVALDDPYIAMHRLLEGREVTGILDAGASTGRVSRKLLRYFPLATAYGFEPNPDYADALAAAAEEEPRFRPEACALADKPGSMELNVTASAGATSFFRPSAHFKRLHPEATEIAKTTAVPVTTVDAWAAERDIPGLELMKLDIQSAELLALRGAAKTLESSTLLVYTEVFFNPMYEGGAIYSEIDLYLRDKGFALFNLYKVRADDRGMLDQGNAIFVHAERLGFA